MKGIIFKVLLEVCSATAEYAEGIAEVLAAVWGDANASIERIRQVISLPSHDTHTVIVGSRVAGFVNGFLTQSAEGIRRWELDLLAVHPEFRGRGLGQALLTRSVSSGFKRGAAYSRGLIRIGNSPSEKAFAHSGYQRLPDPCGLYVSTATGDLQDKPEGLHLVHVETLTYKGVWLEGVLTPQAFAYSQAVRHRDDLDTAGAVIALSEAQTIENCLAAGFAHSGNYFWWRRQNEAAT